jgi:DNA-binding SARP family transcriptional activator
MVGGVRMELRIEVLGPVRAWRGPAELALGPARQRAVFTVLALRAGRSVTRADLVSAVWGVHAPKSVAGNIHTYVSNLRRVLEPDRDRWNTGTLLTSDASGYRLDVEPARVDAVEFGRLVQDGSVEALEAALALWRGDPLSGLPGPFADAARNRFTELRLVAHERRAEALLEAGEYRELAPELAALVAEYPLRERLRELLMLALHHSGQRADALEVFTETRRVLAAELAVEPGESLRDLHARMLEEDIEEQPDLLVVRPDPVSGPFVGRHGAVRRLRTLVDAVGEGRGGAVWVEGDFGIGKSTLLSYALASAPSRGCQLGWVVTDEKSSTVPLGVVRDCVGLDQAATMDMVLARVTELCTRGPLVLVADGMQWADEASVLAWHRLVAAARRLPLLLVAAARPVPRGPALVRLRHELHSRDDILHVGPLTEEETLELQEKLTGTRHVGLVAGAGGNPRYVTELLRDPRSLMETMRRHLDVLSDEARATLRQASLLGTEFTVAGIAAVTGKRPSDLLPVFEEAATANVVAASGDRLAFRQPLLRAACYDEIPAGDRDGLHRQAAEALAGAGAPVTLVAEQLAATEATDPWVLDWLDCNHQALARRVPKVAADLLARAVAAYQPGDPRREVLAAAHVTVLFRLDRRPEREAAEALATATDPELAGQMRHLLATMRFHGGDVGGAIQTLAAAVGDPGVPEIWRRRHRWLLALIRRGPVDDLEATEEAGREALDDAAGDEYLTAHARQTLWLVASVRRDHETALRHVDAALAAVRQVDVLADFQLDLLDNRLFTCQNLDLLDEADRTLAAATETGLAHGFGIPAAVHHYWVGRWNEALVELNSAAEDGPSITFFGLRDPSAMTLLLHGVAALIAGRRGDGIQAAAHLDAVTRHDATDAERQNVDFLLAAQALAAEQHGDRARALAVQDSLLDLEFAPMMLRHQWLPGLVRTAIEAGDHDRVRRALLVCDAEAAKERRTARATAASWWCHGLAEQDPLRVLAAASHYRHVGRVVELGAALEDAAVLLARRGERTRAQLAFNECVAVYTDLSARWDLDRADTRLAEFGIRRSLILAR